MSNETVIDKIKNTTWVCGTHGELNLDELVISVGGNLMCDYCSINQEMQPQTDINPSIKMKRVTHS